VTGVLVDSRRVEGGELFVAVGRGAGFVHDALARGAAAALVPADAFAALAALARAVRARARATVVGITGSTGKTSTKDVLAALCRPHAATVAAEGGHNNEIGLPLTLLRTEPETEVVVAEMGMRGPGQIAELCAIARPQVGVITSVGPVHLELLGTVERVAEAKAEVVAHLEPGGTGVVPADAPLLEPYLRREDVRLVRFGDGGDVRLERFDPPVLVADVAGKRVKLDVPFTARHQARNTLAALAAYAALGLPLDRAGEGAPGIRFSRWRGEEHALPGGGLLINDAYNANPVSMRAALEYLAERAGARRRVAVLGEMAELGRDAPRYHREIGEWARSHAAGIDLFALIGVGELARHYLVDGAAAITAWAPDARGAVERLDEFELVSGYAVLIKGSRSVALERVAEALLGARV
ncbi:MAG: UDP-N-acetylmuramoyl-tripeptide--D-alanyl-D-alanine ligase, partial [Thermoleophilia bacterium]|nr:UDP-N-acetylmuramoyl-tripeptide--D-alanyl-D-alanine ligase [Thermoleophilia bacterium]